MKEDYKMEDKSFVKTVSENYEEMKMRKNDWGLLIFGCLILLLAGLGIYGIVSFGFNILGQIPVKIVLTLSLFLNIIFAFVVLDREE